MKWAVVPASGILVHSVLLTAVQVVSGRNPYTQGTIPGRATAQLPSEKGTYGATPSEQPLVVFNLGVQYNHPLGILAPHASALANHFIAMAKDLSRRRDEYGLRDLSYWRGGERDANSTLRLSMVFRDVEGLHRFAHDELHRKAWDFWIKAGEPSHIGIFHETYCVPAKSYETIYVNCNPVLLANARVKAAAQGEKDGLGQAQEQKQKLWHGTLVSADVPALKTQYARLSRHANGVPKD